MAHELYAQPYSLHATGFYFDTYEEYLEQYAENRDAFGQPVEEYEIQYIDGDTSSELMSALRLNQANLEEVLKWLDGSTEEQNAALYYLTAINSYDFSDAVDKVDDVQLYNGLLEDYAEEYMTDVYEIPERLEPFIDYSKFARDLRTGGDCYEFRYKSSYYVVTNANDV